MHDNPHLTLVAVLGVSCFALGFALGVLLMQIAHAWPYRDQKANPGQSLNVGPAGLPLPPLLPYATRAHFEAQLEAERKLKEGKPEPPKEAT